MDHDRRGNKRSRKESGDQMCRDYEKGTCFRGDRCKFKHPEEENGVSKIPFCKDFRQGVCKFRDCIYVHAPMLLEDEYLKTGWVPRFVLRHCLERFNLCIQYLKENGTCCKGDSCKFGHAMLGLDLNKADFEFSRDANHHMSLDQITRVCGLCNDFVKKNCTKGDDCKYKHCTPVAVGMGNAKTTWADVKRREGDKGYVRGGRGGLLDGPAHVESGMSSSNCPMSVNVGMMGNPAILGDGSMSMGNGGGSVGYSRDEFLMLKRDNEMLRIEVIELKKKNEGLKATNQFLLEENASMRMKQANAGKESCFATGNQSTSYGNSGNSNFSSEVAGRYEMSSTRYGDGSNYGVMNDNNYESRNSDTYDGSSNYSGKPSNYGIFENNGRFGSSGEGYNSYENNNRFSSGRVGRW